MQRGTATPRLQVDQLEIAIDAIVEGSTIDAYWDTLAAFCERDGVDDVAQALARRGGADGPSARWWRCNVLLATDLRPDAALAVAAELAALETAGDGRVFDVDRHALEVSAAIRYLQTHLDRLRTGIATRADQAAAGMVVRATPVARRG